VAPSPADATRDDAVAIVTGGASGAGRTLALELASRGYAVVVVYLGDQGRAEAVVDQIVAANGRAVAVRADIADALDVERLVAETTVAFGGVDIVVHADRRACSRQRRTPPGSRAAARGSV
jgi:3-oxoacyl-[acyl-carrier protein] reductase